MHCGVTDIYSVAHTLKINAYINSRTARKQERAGGKLVSVTERRKEKDDSEENCISDMWEIMNKVTWPFGEKSVAVQNNSTWL